MGAASEPPRPSERHRGSRDLRACSTVDVMVQMDTGGEERRVRLRRLDDCLTILEQAHELDLTTVTAGMVEVLSERVPTIREGMVIADAIEEVLRQQEPYMIQVRPEVTRRVRRRRDPFDVRLLLQRR
jgi:hypothetical protein